MSEQGIADSANWSAQLRLDRVSLKVGIGAVLVLREISCSLQKGDCVALVGPSGAGKTFLLRLLNRLSEATQGTIYLNHQDIRHIPVLQLRQTVVLVPQESKLLGMTVREALHYPLKLRGIPTATLQQRVSDCLERLHIPLEWLDRTEVQLSVGQRQWVAIARALVTQPQVLLLDEPTSALDVGRASHLVQVLRDLNQATAMTIIMVNHQLDVAQEFCQHLLYLNQGQLRMDSPAPQVNWQELKTQLVAAEVKEMEEWTDA